jgi:perosamine synthetase
MRSSDLHRLSHAVILAGAVPIFCDVREDTFCINIAKAKRHLTSKTKAVMPVHLYGQGAYMQAVMLFAAQHRLLEDAAEGGVRYDRRHVGTFGNMVSSYYGSKTITGGEGGVEFPAPDSYKHFIVKW